MKPIPDHHVHRLNHSHKSFTIGNIGVSVKSDLEEALEDFAFLYREPQICEAQVVPRIAMTIKTSRRSRLRGRRYSIWGDGEEISANKCGEEVLPYLEWGINSRVIKTRSDYLQFHAATLALDGKGFVFPAQSGSGKSTLAAGLLSRGWSYLTDELTLIDPDTLFVHPFPKALCIKAGAFGVLEGLGLNIWKGRNYVKALKGRVGYIRPHDVDTGTVGSPCPIRFVIFPKYVEGVEPRLYPISRARAALTLASSALNRHVFGDRAMSIISDVVRGAECYGLQSGRLDETCKLIESLLSPTQSLAR